MSDKEFNSIFANMNIYTIQPAHYIVSMHH